MTAHLKRLYPTPSQKAGLISYYRFKHCVVGYGLDSRPSGQWHHLDYHPDRQSSRHVGNFIPLSGSINNLLTSKTEWPSLPRHLQPDQLIRRADFWLEMSLPYVAHGCAKLAFSLLRRNSVSPRRVDTSMLQEALLRAMFGLRWTQGKSVWIEPLLLRDLLSSYFGFLVRRVDAMSDFSRARLTEELACWLMERGEPKLADELYNRMEHRWRPIRRVYCQEADYARFMRHRANCVVRLEELSGQDCSRMAREYTDLGRVTDDALNEVHSQWTVMSSDILSANMTAKTDAALDKIGSEMLSRFTRFEKLGAFQTSEHARPELPFEYHHFRGLCNDMELVFALPSLVTSKGFKNALEAIYSIPPMTGDSYRTVTIPGWNLAQDALAGTGTTLRNRWEQWTFRTKWPEWKDLKVSRLRSQLCGIAEKLLK